jgi:hypothetical protein
VYTSPVFHKTQLYGNVRWQPVSWRPGFAPPGNAAHAAFTGLRLALGDAGQNLRSRTHCATPSDTPRATDQQRLPGFPKGVQAAPGGRDSQSASQSGYDPRGRIDIASGLRALRFLSFAVIPLAYSPSYSLHCVAQLFFGVKPLAVLGPSVGTDDLGSVSVTMIMHWLFEGRASVRPESAAMFPPGRFYL